VTAVARVVLSAALMLALVGCRSTYYTAWEKLGKEKRELLVDQVKAARGTQKETAEEFKDALTRLQEAYGKRGTELERAYDKVKSRHDSAARLADELKERSGKVARIANDLFAEWEQEINAFDDAEMKRKSRENLRQTRERYGAMAAALDRSQARIQPVLTKLKDHVVFLKHSLNAQAVGGLDTERQEIEKGIAALLQQMNESIREADAFLQSMDARA